MDSRLRSQADSHLGDHFIFLWATLLPSQLSNPKLYFLLFSRRNNRQTGHRRNRKYIHLLNPFQRRLQILPTSQHRNLVLPPLRCLLVRFYLSHRLILPSSQVDARYGDLVVSPFQSRPCSRLVDHIDAQANNQILNHRHNLPRNQKLSTQHHNPLFSPPILQLRNHPIIQPWFQWSNQSLLPLPNRNFLPLQVRLKSQQFGTRPSSLRVSFSFSFN